MNEGKKRDSFLLWGFLAVIFLKGENKEFHGFLLVIWGGDGGDSGEGQG